MQHLLRRLQTMTVKDTPRSFAVPNSQGRHNARADYLDTRWIVKIVAEAYANPGKRFVITNAQLIPTCNLVYVDFDVEEFANRKNKGLGPSNSKTINLGSLDKPATIVDVKGRIIIWFLPEILTSDVHVSDPILLSILNIVG